MREKSIYITGHQAVQLLRMARERRGVQAVPTQCHSIAELPKDVRSVEDLNVRPLLSALKISERNPLTIFAPNDSARIWTKTTRSCLKNKVLSSELPQGAFLELKTTVNKGAIELPPNTKVYISAPALAIVEGAQTLTRMIADNRLSSLRALFNLLRFADECCGFYYRDSVAPNSGPVAYDDFDKPTNLATVAGLDSFVGQLRGVDGLPLARRAVSHAIDGSGSPMESYINHALTLPPRYAGLSMTKPIVNKQLIIGKDEWQRLNLKHRSLRPDFQWPDYKTLAEYLGDKEHAGKRARVEDKNRIQDYAVTPYTAFPLMFDDVRNAVALNNTALMLAQEFAKHGAKREVYRLNRLLKDEDFLGRQRILVSAMLPPVTRYDADVAGLARTALREA